jgi:DNA-binding MurR/RpiR family transcriptional regulator
MTVAKKSWIVNLSWYLFFFYTNNTKKNYTNMTKKRQSALIESSASLVAEKTLYKNTIKKAGLEKLRKEVSLYI